MAHTPGSVTSLPQAVVEILAVLTDHEIDYAKRIVLAVHLADPTLNVTDLARVVGCHRSVARKALSTVESATECPRPLRDSVSTSATECPPSATECPPSRTRVTSLPSGDISSPLRGAEGASTAPTRPEVEEQGSLLGDEPTPPPKAKRKRTLATGTGLSSPELGALGRLVVEARREAGLDVRLLDRVRVESTCAALLKRNLNSDEIVTYARAVPVFTAGSIECEMNRASTVKPAQRKAPKYSASDDADKFEREAAELRANGYRSPTR